MPTIEKPYGANEQMEIWAKKTGSVFVPSAQCLHWIAGEKCNGLACKYSHSAHHWLDHISGWTRGGKRVLLSQPYGFSDISYLDFACKQLGLEASIHGAGWYGNGTVCIEFRQAADAA